MAGYVKRFEELVRRMEGDAGIKILAFEVKPPAPPTALQKVTAEWKVSPKAMSFWAEADGLTLAWRFEDREELDTGSLVGVEFGRIEGGATGIIDLLPLAKIAEWREAEAIHRIDNHQPEGGGAMVLDGSANPAVIFFDDEPHPLNVDVEGYLELLLLTGGLAQWFEALTERSWCDADLVKQVFPRLKLADLRNVVKAAKARR